MDSQLIGRRYQILNRIGGGGMGEVYRALDRLTNTVVALKQVSISGKLLDSIDIGSDFRLALAQEFRVLSSLHHPNIISVLDYGFDAQRRPYFTMELLENAKNIVAITDNKPLPFQINLLVQLLQALAYLHRRGVVHRDLKPDNVMVVGSQVKVLDFGLAAARNRSRDEMQETENLVGTLAYMAPEILAGDGATELSDLYAVGLIAYELIARHAPFYDSDFTNLLKDIATRIPDVSALDVSQDIQDIIAALLAKDPEDRFPNAQSTIEALDKATPFKLEFENSALRESFLQSAAFVGREAELKMLIAALDVARHQNNGSSWLIGGESGIGKSRLMDELRTQALVTGALVLRGQAVAEGSAPYFEWLPILRLLILQMDLSDLEASVLKEIIPGIHILIGRDKVDDAPVIDAISAQTRLLNIIQGLFERYPQPVVILLEDLHWSNESLDVLRRLNEIIANRPMLIVGNYRTEDRPTLPDELPTMKSLVLERLSRSEITELSESIVGEGGKRKEVVDLLSRETEGNIFFIVEVMRVLAEEAGDLSRIGAMTLPASVFAGGIKTVVERRLQLLPLDMLPLLRIAAISGKVVDLNLIRRLNTTLDIDRWLTICADANVLEVQNNEWRFTHDKLRDGLIMELSPTQQAAIHRQVAEAIEALYSDDSTRYVNLAYHWEKAALVTDDILPFDRAIYYLEKAAEQAVENNIHNEGLSHVERLFKMDKQRQERMGTIANRDTHAYWHFLYSQASYGVRRPLPETREHFEKAVRLYGFPIPNSSFGLGLGIVRQILTQFMFRMLPQNIYQAKTEAARLRLMKIAETIRFAGTLYFVSHEQMKSLFTTLQVVNVAEQGGISSELAQAYALVSVLTGNIHLHKDAERYYQRAVDAAEAVQNPVALGQVLFLTGIYHNLAAKHDIAIRDLKRASEYQQQTGNTIAAGYSIATIGSTYFNLGEFDKALAAYNSILQASSSYLPEHRVTSLSFQAKIDAIQARGEDAIFKSLEALRIMDAEVKDVEQLAVNPWSIYAGVLLRREAYASAYEAADTTLKYIEQTHLTAQLGFAALGETAQVYLALAELNDKNRPAPRTAILAKAKQLTSILNQLPPLIGQPVAKRCQAWVLSLEGKIGKAQKLWKSSVEAAERFNLPYETARTYYEWGLHLPQSSPERQKHLDTAMQIFERIEAYDDVRRIHLLRDSTIGQTVAK
jgi:eukaryotic-like serine/threonine-protein kinase